MIICVSTHEGHVHQNSRLCKLNKYQKCVLFIRLLNKCCKNICGTDLICLYRIQTKGWKMKCKSRKKNHPTIIRCYIFLSGAMNTVLPRHLHWRRKWDYDKIQVWKISCTYMVVFLPFYQMEKKNLWCPVCFPTYKMTSAIESTLISKNLLQGSKFFL